MARLSDLFAPLPLFRDDFVERALGTTLGGFAEEGFPSLNIWDANDKVFVEAELSGVAPADLDVSVAGADLTISGNRKAVDPANGTKARQERPSGQFSRTVTLPWETEADKVEAVLRDGVLTITLTKAVQCRPKKVTVRAT